MRAHSFETTKEIRVTPLKKLRVARIFKLGGMIIKCRLKFPVLLPIIEECGYGILSLMNGVCFLIIGLSLHNGKLCLK